MTQRHNFPAGKYYISDPCYVVADEDWDKLIETTGCFGLDENEKVVNWYDGVFYYRGQKCFASGTMHGDGVYSDNKSKNRMYGVDAGLIGIMPIEAVDESLKVHGGHWFSFDKNFIVYEDDGVFHFGDVEIDTN